MSEFLAKAIVGLVGWLLFFWAVGTVVYFYRYFKIREVGKTLDQVKSIRKHYESEVEKYKLAQEEMMDKVESREPVSPKVKST